MALQVPPAPVPRVRARRKPPSNLPAASSKAQSANPSSDETRRDGEGGDRARRAGRTRAPQSDIATPRPVPATHRREVTEGKIANANTIVLGHQTTLSVVSPADQQQKQPPKVTGEACSGNRSLPGAQPKTHRKKKKK